MNYILLIIIITLLLLHIYFSIKIFIENFSDNYDNIDAFIYINLEDREDRKTQFLEELNKLEIPKNKIRKISGVRIPKNGHKGCIQSHILALQMAKLNKWKTVAIFEDDAELTVEPSVFRTMTDKAINITTKGYQWDMIVLHGANQTKKSDIDDDIYYLKHSTQSTGYIIKDTYYDKLLNLFIHCNDMMSPNSWEIEGSWEGHALDQMWNKLIEKDNWIGFKNNLLKQRNVSSSINS
jgi:GR25 family glycosyltransferase involved in LPS biosynthesis